MLPKLSDRPTLASLLRQTSYPRTETSKYAPGFDLAGTLTCLSEREDVAGWLPQASALHQAASAAVASGEASDIGAALAARASSEGMDCGDHPPITPIKAASTVKQCDGELGWQIYQYICKHFVASLSDDCSFDTATVTVDLGGEKFEAHATTCVHLGWAEPLGVRVVGEGEEAAAAYARMASIRAGERLPITQAPKSTVRWTQPPPHLSESDLLGLMEAHGVGTDASMATHVSNVIKRGYVTLDEYTRRLAPAPLGLALIHAYSLIDEGLSLPCVRASIEKAW